MVRSCRRAGLHGRLQHAGRGGRSGLPGGVCSALFAAAGAAHPGAGVCSSWPAHVHRAGGPDRRPAASLGRGRARRASPRAVAPRRRARSTSAALGGLPICSSRCLIDVRPPWAWHERASPRVRLEALPADLRDVRRRRADRAARQGERVTVFALSRPDEPFTHGFLDELRRRVVYLPHRPLASRVRRGAGARARAGGASPGGWLAARAGAALRRPSLRRGGGCCRRRCSATSWSGRGSTTSTPTSRPRPPASRTSPGGWAARPTASPPTRRTSTTGGRSADALRDEARRTPGSSRP